MHITTTDHIRWPIALAFILVMTLLFLSIRLEERRRQYAVDQMQEVLDNHRR